MRITPERLDEIEACLQWPRSVLNGREASDLCADLREAHARIAELEAIVNANREASSGDSDDEAA